MKTALICGIGGQDGAYLAQLLIDKGDEVYGGLRRNSHDELFRLRVLGVQDQVKLLNFDITEGSEPVTLKIELMIHLNQP